MSRNRRENQSFPRIFKGFQERTGHHKNCGALPAIKPYLLAIRFHGVNKKGELFPGLLPTSPRSVALPHIQTPRRLEYLRSGLGILTRFPCDPWSRIGRFETEIPYLLGSTNPCPTAVHMEPFSTSVFKVLI